MLVVEQVRIEVPVTFVIPAVGKGFTTTVTSFETTADPHVGVDVQTIIQVPAPKIAPVGVNELPVCPDIGVIVPFVTVL